VANKQYVSAYILHSAGNHNLSHSKQSIDNLIFVCLFYVIDKQIP